MNEFWTEKKLGKHQKLAKQAELLYEHYAMCSASKLLSRLKASTFKFGNYGPCAWKNILIKANLDDCLQQEYVEEALNVTSARPSIGKGEFLFVSLFNNVGFAKEKGDLIDINTDKRVEVKGSASTIGNGNSNSFKTLNQSLLQSICVMLHESTATEFNAKTCTRFKEAMGIDKQLIYKVIEALQNTTYSYREIVEAAVQQYLDSGKLLRTVAAMHLLAYVLLEKIDYLLAVNNDAFMCFDAPKSIVSAAKILDRFEIHGWRIGKSGVSVTLK